MERGIGGNMHGKCGSWPMGRRGAENLAENLAESLAENLAENLAEILRKILRKWWRDKSI